MTVGNSIIETNTEGNAIGEICFAACYCLLFALGRKIYMLNGTCIAG